MKKIFNIYLILTLIFTGISSADAAVRVKGYRKKDGTYVQSHYRSDPDSSVYNNWSTKGNINPYTGEEGTKKPHGSSSSSFSSPTYNYPSRDSTPSQPVKIPANASATFYGWKCNYGHKRNYLYDKCEPVITPPNSHLNYIGDDWICDEGFSKDYLRENCKKVIIPENAHLNMWGNGWECDTGYLRLVGKNLCVTRK